VPFAPIGNKNDDGFIFSGQLDGNGYGIYHLNIQHPEKQRDQPTGLFSHLAGATITHLKIFYSQALSRPDYDVGMLAGKVSGAGALINDVSLNSIILKNFPGSNGKDREGASGGLIGTGANLDISNVKVSNINIQRNKFAGGLIGKAGKAEIDYAEVHNINNLDPYQDIGCRMHEPCGFGGLIGRIEGAVTVQRSSVNDGLIRAERVAGGFVGFVNVESTAKFIDSYSNIEVHAKYLDAGGIIGNAQIMVNQPDNHNDIIFERVFVLGKSNMKAMVGSGGNRVVDKGDDTELCTRLFELDCSTSYTLGNQPGVDVSVQLSTIQMQNPDDIQYFGKLDDLGDYIWSREVWHMESGQYPTLQPKPID